MEFLKSWFWFLSLLQKLFMGIIFDILFTTLRYLFLLFIKATRNFIKQSLMGTASLLCRGIAIFNTGSGIFYYFEF